MLKVGDKVKIKYAKDGYVYHGVRANDVMEKYVGKEATVIEVETQNIFLDIDERWTWDESMLELICVNIEDEILLEYVINKLGTTKEELIKEIEEKREEEVRQKEYEEFRKEYDEISNEMAMYCDGYLDTHKTCKGCKYEYINCEIAFTIDYVKNKYINKEED